MNRKAAVSAASTTGLWSQIAEDGGNPEKVFRGAGLSRADALDSALWIPQAQYRRLLELAVAETGDDCLGLHVGSRFDPKNYGVLGYAVLNCATLGQAVSSAVQYFQVMRKGTRFSLDATKEAVSVTFHMEDGPADLPRTESELALTRVCSGIRRMIGDDWAPCETHFAHDGPAGRDEYESFFGSPVRFGMDTNRLLFRRSDFARRNAGADRRLYEILRLQMESLMPKEGSDDLMERLKDAVSDLLSEAAPLPEVAGRLGVGARTLQRRLRDRGRSFNQVVEEVRRQRCFQYLRRRDLSISEIAYRLGYSEASAFDRAFRRWAGTSPLQFRRAGLRDDQAE